MAFIIAGHERSGTTLLRNLCNRHPDITVTMEFGNFAGLGMSYLGYSRQILKRCWQQRHRSFLVQGHDEEQWTRILESYAFVARYLFEVNRHRKGCIDVSTIDAALGRIFPVSRVVGDKIPRYVFKLDRLAGREGLKCVIIYRDCRDVTASYLRMVHTKWRGKKFINRLDTADKIATRWVQAIELMERHRDRLHIIRYENLITEPDQQLKALAQYIGVDAGGFPRDMIRGTNIGKYNAALSAEQLAQVMSIAGPTLEKLSYL